MTSSSDLSERDRSLLMIARNVLSMMDDSYERNDLDCNVGRAVSLLDARLRGEVWVS